MLREANWTTEIKFGAAGANDTLPFTFSTVVVENNPNTFCYDAIWMRDLHLAIIDCARKTPFGAMENIFYYVNTTSETVLSHILKNDIYVPYEEIHRRRLMVLREPDGGNYLLRAYFGDGVDFKHRKNTYLEVLTFTDPLWPRTLKILDRSFLNQDSLEITDFKLYMGNLYLLDYHSGVIVFDFTPAQHILVLGRYRTDSGFLRLGVYSGNEDDEIIFALSNRHAIYEVDFSNQLKPDIVAKYSIMHDAIVHELWVNREYVIAQFSANATSTENVTQLYNTTIVFSRKTRSYMHAHEVYEHSTSHVIIDL